MKQTQKAPKWVMAGVLGVVVLSCIPGIMLSVGLITPETISFSDEYGQSVSSSFVPGLWMLNVIAVFFFITTTVLSFVKRWNKAVAIGSIILVLSNLADIWIGIMYSTASSYEELMMASNTARIVGFVGTLLYVVGNLLIAFNTSISNLTKILFAIFVVIFSLVFLIPFPPAIYSGISNALTIIKPVFALVLLYLCVTSKQRQIV